ncbi:MAG: type II toxin-antitoxin system RelE/ParE family toxin [Coriobacteriia bacterium]
MTASIPKDIIWVSSSLNDLQQFPDSVRQMMGFALFQSQCGGKHLQAKPLKGFKGAGVLEVVEDFDGNTFRTMYTVRFADAVYVLHAFQKKSKKGLATPKHEMDVVRSRLRMVQESHRGAADRKEGKSR